MALRGWPAFSGLFETLSHRLVPSGLASPFFDANSRRCVGNVCSCLFVDTVDDWGGGTQLRACMRNCIRKRGLVGHFLGVFFLLRWYGELACVETFECAGAFFFLGLKELHSP